MVTLSAPFASEILQVSDPLRAFLQAEIDTPRDPNSHQSANWVGPTLDTLGTARQKWAAADSFQQAIWCDLEINLAIPFAVPDSTLARLSAITNELNVFCVSLGERTPLTALISAPAHDSRSL